MKKLLLAPLTLIALLLGALPAVAQTTSAVVVAICGTTPTPYTAGANRQVTQDPSGKLCTDATITPAGTQDVNIVGINGAAPVTGSGTAIGALRVELPTNGTGTIATITNPVTVAQPTAANFNATVVGTGTFAVQAATSPAARTIITLDIKTVTTGGVAVNAISTGHRTAGGFLQNPIGATIALCINEIGTASGTTSSGDTTCIQPGQSYTVSPASTAVSVITSDSSHPFSGYGLN